MTPSSHPKYAPKWLVWALLLVFVVLVYSVAAPIDLDSLAETRKSKAQLGCAVLDRAIKAYFEHEANTKHELPTTLHDLVEPPFGGTSFLQNGESDLIDPWGKPYQMERARTPDGEEFILVKTTTPDGTPISQFGVGAQNSVPRFE